VTNAQADERGTVEGLLDWQRAVAVDKVEGLTLEQARSTPTVSALSILGLLHHLAWAERLWFRRRFLGEAVADATIEQSFVVPAGASVESVVADYQAACDESRAVVAAAPGLDALAVEDHPFWGNVSLRWVLGHLLEETARHNGHLDILRESIDGRTG
jgi:hypothetical protein